jgi:hypothetical protein
MEMFKPLFRLSRHLTKAAPIWSGAKQLILKKLKKNPMML